MATERAARRRDDRGRTWRRSRRRHPATTWAIRVLALAVAFWIGLAVGKAIGERPRPGGTQTLVRTLKTGTLPVPVRTVTVTTGSP
jgi:hypothetical protein